MCVRPCCLLVDNGSLRAASALGLRVLAAALSEAVGHPVRPVSLLHSDQIPAAELGGERAPVLETFLARQRAEGIDSFLVVPLFFGRSAAMNEYLPQRVRELHRDWPRLELRIAPCLVDIAAPDDTAVAEILADHVRAVIERADLTKPALALVDHGSPRREVTAARDLVADQLATLLDGEVERVRACSMERRPGAAYDFNEPLLESVLGSEGFDRQVVLAQMFSLPGNHAGRAGDIEQICRRAEARGSGLVTHVTELFAAHPKAVDLLRKRLRQGMESPPLMG